MLSAEGPCDIYAAAGTPCVAAHAITRALYADYDGPLYRVNKTDAVLDIGVVATGGVADASAVDAFCPNVGDCFVDIIYDQSGQGNDLGLAPKGGACAGPLPGGFDRGVDAKIWRPRFVGRNTARIGQKGRPGRAAELCRAARGM